ncbi:hypothetical protein HHI36_021067 [Cryptolaemus montrouzieri]|uniref:Uncharacterized protein n=1 Tax=Cryptolaemus montrouzieri TaxID=559131 RepID=A0ABD2MVN4_9CUCU
MFLEKSTHLYVNQEDLREHQEEEVEKVLERNKGLKCLGPSYEKLAITPFRNREMKKKKRSFNSWKNFINIYTPPRYNEIMTYKKA